MKSRTASLVSALAAVLLIASCGTPKKIVYFQDEPDGHSVLLPQKRAITLQPEDKISIIVKSRDYNLTNLFNLPYFTQRIGTSAETANTIGFTQGIAGYLVDDNGCINFPVLGNIKVAGMTRAQVSDYIEKALIEGDYVKDPLVIVDYMNLRVGVMGEVTTPGRYPIDHDEYTVLDALSAAGDLTIYGRRDNIKVLRTEGGRKYTYYVNINSVDSLAQSPAYYLRQNDIIYVEPNNVRARQSTVNGNNILSTSFWISVASLASTVALYFVRTR